MTLFDDPTRAWKRAGFTVVTRTGADSFLVASTWPALP